MVITFFPFISLNQYINCGWLSSFCSIKLTVRNMAATKKSYLETLPVEVIHRIYDELDVDTILFSVRPVCKKLYSTANAYNRYQLDFSYISRSDFHIISRVIDPKNVISLTLVNNLYTFHQIQLFHSCFHLDQFVQLRSLTLIGAEQEDLLKFEKYVSKSSLTKVSILYFDSRSTVFQTLVSSMLSLNHLHKLTLNLGYYVISDLQWPAYCSIKKLKLVGSWNWNKVYFVLSHSPHLQTLSITGFTIDESDTSIIRQSDLRQFDHLISFSLYTKSRITIQNMKTIFICFPNLTHLRLFDGEYQTDDSSDISLYQTDSSLFDGDEWECLIQAHLTKLKQFEFYFSRFSLLNEDSIRTMQSLMMSFSKPFWLEDKHWTVKYDYEYQDISKHHYITSRSGGITDYSHRIHLYSTPIFHNSFHYSKLQTKILHSMLNVNDNKEPIVVRSSELTIDGEAMIIQGKQNKARII